jgi:hypothetical protein
MKSVAVIFALGCLLVVIAAKARLDESQAQVIQDYILKKAASQKRSSNLAFLTFAVHPMV